jgi:nucleoside-diphosphate-sugar epimerase
MTKQEWKTNLRALVVGGAGFVGSHLCRRLLQSGYEEVICVDNLQTGRIANVADLLGSPHFSFFEHDIVNECVPVRTNRDKFKIIVHCIANDCIPAFHLTHSSDTIN